MLKKTKLEVEDFLCLLIIICPILDILSFLYRNIFNTSVSPSTFLRPIITISVTIYLFFKNNKNFKIGLICASAIYLIYGLVHLYIFEQLKTGSSYSNVIHEAQYIINYSFMILNLFIFTYCFKENNTIKLKNSIIIAMYIYILSIFISIITNTSSSTYIEGMGKKGWFESGNSIGTILILGLFIYIQLLDDRRYRKAIIPLIVLSGIFLTMILGTRVGLYGFIIVLIVYIIVEILYKLLTKNKINKKVIAMSIFSICTILLLILTIGSTTLQRRRHLENIENNIIDEKNNGEAHVTGSILEIKNKIEEGTIEESYMTESQKKSILQLYEISNNLKITNNDQRTQQLIYNLLLVKNQKEPLAILFGNGYLNNFRELVLEMEIPAFLLNFGLVGFTLYCMPFLIIFVYGIIFGIRNLKKISKEYMMLILGTGFSFIISFFAGYTFFNSSSMIIIIVINTLLLNEINKLKKEY